MQTNPCQLRPKYALIPISSLLQPIAALQKRHYRVHEMSVLLCSLVCAFLVLVLQRFYIARTKQTSIVAYRECQPIPQVRTEGWFGLETLWDVLRANREQRFPQYVTHTFDTIGEGIHTMKAKILGSTTVMTRDPENVKSVFVSNASRFDISSHRAGSFRPLLGPGLLSLRGEAWRHSRSAIQPQFYRGQIANLALYENHARVLNDVLQVGNDGWTRHVDLQPLFFNMTLDVGLTILFIFPSETHDRSQIVTEFIFGRSVNSQSTTARAFLNKEANVSQNWNDFGHHFDSAKAWLNTRMTLGKWHWLAFSMQFAYHCKQVHKYMDQFIAKRLTEVEKDEKTKDRFVLLDELARQTQDPLKLRSESLHILSAGRDTTASLLSWMFYFLARHPSKYTKLRTIILEDFGTDEATIKHANLRSCHYLTLCIDEVLRLIAVAPIVERVCVEDAVLPRGGGPDGKMPIFIPRGHRFLISTYGLQRRADIWGPDVAEFRPERWEERESGWEFVPFGGGQRKCIGRKAFLSIDSHLSTAN